MKADTNPALDGLAAYTGKFAEQGTKASGFSTSGPFHCGDCVHLFQGGCLHPAVMNDPDLEDRKKEDGSVEVDPKTDCCRFVRVEE